MLYCVPQDHRIFRDEKQRKGFELVTVTSFRTKTTDFEINIPLFFRADAGNTNHNV